MTSLVYLQATWLIGFRAGDDKFPKNPDGSLIYSDTHYCETWAAMEKLVEEGLVKHIRLSVKFQQQTDWRDHGDG